MHNCATVVDTLTTPRLVLKDTPLTNSDLILYTDGSLFVEEGCRKAGFAVCNDYGVVVSGALLTSASAQLAEMVAFTAALEQAERESVTCYAHSCYAVGCVHDFGTIWKNKGFLISGGTPVKHAEHIEKLQKAVQ